MNRSSSAVRYANVSSDDERGTTKRMRQGHLMALLPITKKGDDDVRVLDKTRVYFELSAFLAFKHIQQRSGEVLPGLPEQLGACDFQWTYRHHDTQFSPIHAARELAANLDFMLADEGRRERSITLDVYNLSNITTAVECNTAKDNSKCQNTPLWNHPEFQVEPSTQQPFALLGAARSSVSEVVSILAETMKLPQISSSSTASDLDDSPYFARTIQTSGSATRALMAYLRSLGVEHVGLLYFDDNWGRTYRKNLADSASEFDIKLYPVGYAELDKWDDVMQQLKDFQVYYFVGALEPGNWREAILKAYEYDIMGRDQPYQWYFADMLEVVSEGFVLDETEWEIARALDGTGVVQEKVERHAAFDKALAAITNDTTLQREFFEIHSEPHLLENFTFDYPGYSHIQYLTYDAVIALGITSCNTPGLFDGSEFYNNLLQVDFLGVSGRVQLDDITGARQEDSTRYEIVNLLIKPPDHSSRPENSTRPQRNEILFERNSSAVIDFPPNMTEGRVVMSPFKFHNGSSIPPPGLPSADIDMNLIPSGVVVAGYVLAALVMTQSVGWSAWVYYNKKSEVIKAAQPEFLLMLCLGTFLMAAAIVPMGFQEPWPGLDGACQLTPWLLCLGFCVAVSALLSKAIRINRLLNSGTRFRRVKVNPKDVMLPFMVLTVLNVALLTAWTISPYNLVWKRQYENNYDEYGRQVESFGMCRPNGGQSFYFSIPLLLVNLVGLSLATYHTFAGRHLPLEFGEANSLTISTISFSETVLLGFPTLGAVINAPAGFFAVVSIMICVGCLALLLPVFVPKYLAKKSRGRPSVQSSLFTMNGSLHAGRNARNGRNPAFGDPPSRSGSMVMRNSGTSSLFSMSGSMHAGRNMGNSSRGNSSRHSRNARN